MALTDTGEKFLADLVKSAGFYVGLSLAATELSTAHGYDRSSRAHVTPANLRVNSSNRRIEVVAALEIYRANDGSAIDATHVVFYAAADSPTGEYLFDPQVFGTNIAAPLSGQAVNLDAGYFIDLKS